MDVTVVLCQLVFPEKRPITDGTLVCLSAGTVNFPVPAQAGGATVDLVAFRTLVFLLRLGVTVEERPTTTHKSTINPLSAKHRSNRIQPFYYNIRKSIL